MIELQLSKTLTIEHRIGLCRLLEVTLSFLGLVDHYKMSANAFTILRGTPYYPPKKYVAFKWDVA